MAAEQSRWSRRFVFVGALSLVCWQIGTLVGVPRRTAVTLALFGFVFHVVFGKAYALVPPYFDADLSVPQAPAVQFPLVVLGTASLGTEPLIGGDPPVNLAAIGSLLWLAGVLVFAGTMASTIAGPLVRGETGTGEHNADRRPVDLLANLFVPVVLAYLLVGSYETAALHVDLLPALVGIQAAVTHLLAAGAAALLVFTLGFRLLPRFFGAHPSRWSAAAVLPAGALAPALLVVGFGGGTLFTVGAALEAAAVLGFALVVACIGRQAKRRRVGMYGVLVGVAFGVVGVAIGLSFALTGIDGSLIGTHLRVNLLGFLGLVIVGVSFQFYPPVVGSFPGSSDRSAAVSIGLIATGLIVELLAELVAGPPLVTTLGNAVAALGAFGYAYLVTSAFVARSV